MMNVKFLNPFVESACDVLKSELGLEIKRGDLLLETKSYVTSDITVIIALVGAVEGTVFYSMDEDVARGISSLLMGETMLEFNALAQSGIAELGNVITGRASMKLSEAGLEANISPPSMIMGRGATISTLDYPRLVVPLLSDVGQVVIHLALREGRSNLKTGQMAVPTAPRII
jgi:chemotaxis protein CheX